MTIYLRADQLDAYILKYMARLEKQGLNEEEVDVRIKSHLRTNVVIKYSKEWQDAKYNELLYLITDVPGGYWQVQELIRIPHVEFQHYTQTGRRSYEKGNVTLTMAKKELPARQFEIYKLLKVNKSFKKDGVNELDVDIEFTGKFSEPKKTNETETLIKENKA